MLLIGGVKPSIILVAVVLVTVLVGFLPGITWAFVGGLAANLLVGDPLGSVPLSLLVVAAVVAGGARLLGRMSWIYPVIAVALGSIVADIASLAIGRLVAGGPLLSGLPTELMMGAALLNAALAGILLVPARLLVLRYGPDEAPAW